MRVGWGGLGNSVVGGHLVQEEVGGGESGVGCGSGRWVDGWIDRQEGRGWGAR